MTCHAPFVKNLVAWKYLVAEIYLKLCGYLLLSDTNFHTAIYNFLSFIVLDQTHSWLISPYHAFTIKVSMNLSSEIFNIFIHFIDNGKAFMFFKINENTKMWLAENSLIFTSIGNTVIFTKNNFTFKNTHFLNAKSMYLLVNMHNFSSYSKNHYWSNNTENVMKSYLVGFSNCGRKLYTYIAKKSK